MDSGHAILLKCFHLSTAADAITTDNRSISPNLALLYGSNPRLVSKGFRAPGFQGSGLKKAGLRGSGPKLTGLQGSREFDQGLQAPLNVFALIQNQILELI